MSNTVGGSITTVSECGMPNWRSKRPDWIWPMRIKTRMDAGLALVGNDVGTPIIAFTASGGREVGAFGPVITKVPSAEDSLRLWEAFVTMAELEEFWELKRTRTKGPEFGQRP